MQSLDVIVASPAGAARSSLAIAACRAGYLGLLDLEFCSAPDALDAVADLARFTTTPFGIKVGPETGRLMPELLTRGSNRLAWVVLAGGDSPDLPALVEQIHRANRRVYFEAVSVTEGRRAVQFGADAIILVGQEAGGRVGSETSFILLQRWLAEAEPEIRVPIYVRGGVGPHTAAACLAVGVSGIVLDAQVLLVRESPLSTDLKRRAAACDGSETVLMGERLAAPYRIYSRPGLPVLAELTAEEDRLVATSLDSTEKRARWRQIVHRLAVAGPERGPWLLGQDVALAGRSGTVASFVDSLLARARHSLETARSQRPLAEGSPLAARHGLRYPIFQGPMTRVSDTAAFADSVARGGALPFLALALLRQAETEALLSQTRERLGDLPWGVGILGFVPAEIRNEQLAAIRKYRPPIALIAGGRPDQARELEKEGIPTYLHVPSPGLLRRFLEDGARRFVFEGRECGGHVGPRTSFVLWETMIGVLLEHLGKSSRGEDLAVVFAGGIHDARSAAMVAALAAPLAERGVGVGVLMGTAYLFTKEIVEGGAIVPRFQQEALDCTDTLLLQTAPGHAIRCVPSPYCDDFLVERQRLLATGRPPEEVARTLEWMNIGRLRLASKGIERAADAAPGPRLVSVSEEEQHARGMYMIGQVASLRESLTTVAELHDDVSRGATELLGGLPLRLPGTAKEEPTLPPCDIAIVGMACFYPGAKNVSEFWHNILDKRNVVTEVPASHWDWRLYYDADPRARDRIVSRWGGFLQDIAFDPLDYGITPKSLTSIEPLQLFLLEASRQALLDGGYDWKDDGQRRPFPRERTAAILGIGGGGSPLAVQYGFRTCLPLLDCVPGLNVDAAQVLEQSRSLLPEWTEDSFPGILFNVAVGRVANRFNFGGPNYAIDAACGSSLAAVQACVRELEMGTSDLAIALGADTVQTPYAYMAFSKTHALSPNGRCRPFDAGADGIVLSEGIGAVVLKRLADAERDGDKIYAVIKGMGASSDGRDKGLTAPRAEGQLRALTRAYGQAHVSPARVELVEAHGTGTVVGDQTEARALALVMEQAGAEPQSCAVGSVKSMIGHTKCAAGIAGLIKAAQALHRKALPPTLVETPNPRGNFEDGPLYLNTETRPWVHGEGPRLAGVSAFGFGGTNFHAVLSEYEGEFLQSSAGFDRWPAELFVWSADDRQALKGQIEHCLGALRDGAQPALSALAASTWKAARRLGERPTLALLAGSLEELTERLTTASERLSEDKAEFSDPRGVYYASQPSLRGGKVAFLFPGQGSQYPNMLAQLALAFPMVRRTLDDADRILANALEKPLSRFLYPGSAFRPETEKAQREALTRSDVAQPALGACSLGITHVLATLGIQPDFLAGHSYGEFVALCVAGVLSEEDLLRLSWRRGQVIRASTNRMPGGMAALDVDVPRAEALLAGIADVQVANSNSPTQTVIAGGEEGLRTLLERCSTAGVRGQRLPVACAFHSPYVAAAREPLARAIAECTFHPAGRVVFSNTKAAPYPSEPAAMAATLVEHLTSPVRFREQVEAMYSAGARLFVEVGPQAVLTGLVRQTLAGCPHLAVATDMKGRSGVVQILQAVAQLVVHGLPVRPESLFEGRGVEAFDLSALSATTGVVKPSPTTWIINSVRNRPLDGPEPLLLGQPRTLEAAKTQRPTAAPVEESKPARNSSVTNGEAPHVGTKNGKPAPAPAPLASAPVNGDAAQVMLRFQDVMARFLDTQKAVMNSYLQGGGSAPTAHLPLPAMPVKEKTAPPESRARETPARPAVAPAPASAPPAPASAPVARVEEKKSPAATPDRAWITGRLQDLISQRTGYPRDMLGLDTNLEADLGIDSIKRVEILAEMAQALGGDAQTGLPAGLEMEKLTAIGTLRGIIDYLDAGLGQSSAKPAARPSPNGGNGGSSPSPNGGNGGGTPIANGGNGGAASSVSGSSPAIQRAVVALVDCPLLSSPSALLGSGIVVFTDDGRGIAWSMAGRLADVDRQTVVLTTEGEEKPGVYRVDVANEKAVAEVLARVRKEHGPISGLVHLLPLAVAGDMPWDERASRDTRSLYLLVRQLEEDLRSAGKQGHSFILSATALGGAFGFGDQPLPADYTPGHGGILGFLKCLGQEWPEVTVRTVDLESVDAPAADVADRLLAEVSASEGPFEVGYRQGRRLTWAPRAMPLVKKGAPATLLEPGAPVLVTGGARGITAEVALELARRYRPTLLLVGRSPLPAELESDETAGKSATAEIKAVLIAQLEREGRPAVPARIESAYNRLLQDREIRDNLRRLRETGAVIHYYSVDVRDPLAFGGLLDEVQSKYGPLAGVIHGAGVIEDRLVRAKTPDSFDRVFETKVKSARVLEEKLIRDRLQFLVFFASLASRYGNKGQSDYAAANEVLSKLALRMNREGKARVVSIAWGPWSGVGMVADLEKHLVQRGLRLIGPGEGPGLLLDELVHGARGDSEVVLAGGAEAIVSPGRRETSTTSR